MFQETSLILPLIGTLCLNQKLIPTKIISFQVCIINGRINNSKENCNQLGGINQTLHPLNNIKAMMREESTLRGISTRSCSKLKRPGFPCNQPVKRKYRSEQT
ncbi:unnamed protein product [Dovyalis caffra]|uniref:Uncharacterized protein n=1 Tax=Dovyalis caffra TaxID=77055 RepID=A0AAV1QQS3_9ROSI|nr:unnamed protein product [Dovyalis caffra]